MSPDDVIDGERKRNVENFFTVYLKSYEETINARNINDGHLPSFYKGAPYNIEVHILPNNCLCALFKKSKETRCLAVGGDYDEIKKGLESRSFDFMKALAPHTELIEDEAWRMGRADAELDLENSRRMDLLADVEVHLEHVKKDVNSMLELNPWLDEHADTQTEKVNRARDLIKELYRVTEMDESERFARYERELMELRAFEGALIEKIAGEMEAEVESVVGELEGQMGLLEDKMAAIESELDAMKKSLEGGPEREIAELRQMVVEMTTKVDSVNIAAGAGMDDELEDEFKSIRSSLTKTTTKLGKLEKQVRDVKKEATITDEVKETVFRDSKRVHNLNERIGDIEAELKRLASETAKDFGPDIKAMKKRMDKFERDMQKKIEKMVVLEVEKHKPPAVAETPPPPPSDETTGGGKGKTVKKTTKTTRTKRTKKKA